MSKTVDERIVAMHFENQQFEKGAKETIKTLDELKKGLDFEGVGESLDKVSKATEKSFNLKDTTRQTNLFTKALKGLGNVAAYPFQAMAQSLNNFNGYLRTYMGFDLASKLINTGREVLRAFTIDPLRTGWNEYELKMDSIKTIMTGTRQEYEKMFNKEGRGYSEEEHLEAVKQKLEELNVYADKTIYSFSDMTSNIGKFTNNGVALDQATSAIKGISNATAQAGQGANEASRAMYNLSQAIGMGKLTTIDYKSLENANIATKELKQAFIDVGYSLGKLQKQGDKYFTTTGKKLEVTAENFRDTLQSGWIDKDVMVATLAAYSGDYTAEALASTFHIKQEVATQLYDIGQAALKAAEEVRTFSKMWDALKEAAQSGWALSWELVFGDMKEGSTFWTELNKKFSEMLDGAAKKRNDLLRGWRGEVMDADKNQMIETIKTIFKADYYKNQYGVQKWFDTEKGYEEIVGKIVEHFEKKGTAPQAIEELITYLNKEYSLKEADARQIIMQLADDFNALDYTGKDGREDLTQGIYNIIDAFMNLKDAFSSIRTAIYGETTASGLQNLTERFKAFTDRVLELTEAFKTGEVFEKIKKIFIGLNAAFQSVLGTIKNLVGIFGQVLKPIADFALDVFAKISEWISGIAGPTLSKTIGNIIAKLKGLTKIKIAEWFNKVKKTISNFFKTIGKTITKWLKDNGFTKLAEILEIGYRKIKQVWDTIKAWKGWESIAQFFTSIWTWFETKYNKIKQHFSPGENGEPSKISKWLTSAQKKISKAWNTVVGWPGWEKIGKFISGIYEWIIDKVNGVKSFFNPETNTEYATIANWITTAYTTISGAWDTAYGWFSQRFTEIGNFFGGIFSWIKSKANILPATQEDIEKAQNDPDMMAGWIFSAYNKISNAWTAAYAWFSPRLAMLGDFFTSIYEWIKSKASIVAQAFQEGENGEPSLIAQWITSAYNWISNAWTAAYAWFSPRLETLGDFFTSVWEWIKTKASIVAGAFKEGENGEPSAIAQWITDAYNWISNAWTEFSNWITPILGDIGGFLVSAYGWIMSKAQGVAQLFKTGEDGQPSAVAQWITDAYHWISDAWNQFYDWIEPYLGDIGSFITNAFGWIKAQAVAAYNAVKPDKNGNGSAVSRYINETYRSVKNAWEKVYNWDGWRLIGLFISDLWGFILNPTFIQTAGAETLEIEAPGISLKKGTKNPNKKLFEFYDDFEETAGVVTDAANLVEGAPDPAETEAKISIFSKILQPILDTINNIAQTVAGSSYTQMFTSIAKFIGVFAESMAKIIGALADYGTALLDKGDPNHTLALWGTIGTVLVGIIGKIASMSYAANVKAVLVNNTDTLGNRVMKLAGAVALIAVAISFIGNMDTAALVQGGLAVVILMGILGFIMTKFANSGLAGNGGSEMSNAGKVFTNLGENLIKWAGILGALAIVFEELPKIIDALDGKNLDEGVIMDLFLGLTIFVGGIMLISSLGNTRLMKNVNKADDLEDLGAKLIDTISILGSIAISMAMLPKVIDAIGKAGITDGSVILKAFEGLALMILGFAAAFTVLSKAKVDPTSMIKVSFGLAAAIGIFLVTMVAFIQGVGGLLGIATGEKIDKDFAYDGLVNFIEGMGRVWTAIKTAFGSGTTDANGEAIGGVSEAITEASAEAENINVEGLNKLEKAIGITKNITDALQSWAEGYKFGTTYEDFQSELRYITRAIGTFSQDASSITAAFNVNDVLAVGEILEQLMTVANLAQLLEAIGAGGGADFTWFKFAASLQEVTDGLSNANGAQDLADSIYGFASFAEMVQGALDDAAASINVTPLITRIAEGIVNPKSRQELALAFQQLGNDVSNKSGVSSEVITKVANSGGVDTSNLNLFSGLFGDLFKDFNLDNVFGDFTIGNIKDYIDPEGEGIGLESILGFSKDDLTNEFAQAFDSEAIRKAIMGENGEGGLDMKSFFKNADYTETINSMITDMQQKLDSGEYSLSVTTVGNWDEAEFTGDNTLTINGMVSIMSGDISTITSHITNQTTRVVTAIGNLSNRMLGIEAAISNMSIVLDTGAVAGAVDKQLGKKVTTNNRTTYTTSNGPKPVLADTGG